MEKIKIAHCMTSLAGGVGKVVMNYFDNMPCDEYEVHIITQSIKSAEYVNLYENRGYYIHVVPSKKEGVYKNLKAVYRILKYEKIDIAHCHMTATNFFPLLSAKLSGIQVRINHSHLAEDKNFLERFLCLLAKTVDTDRFACGQEAGRSVFGNSAFTVMSNAIDLRKYRYDQAVREQERKLLGLEANKVICHVGRFTAQKNHTFLIDVFETIYKQDPSYRLLLVGEGELLENIKNKVESRGLTGKVIFTGLVEDVSRKLQASDIFVLPSKFEGLCLAAIEAQAVGVPCVFSGTVDRQTKINDNVVFVEQFDVEKWSEIIQNTCLECRSPNQKNLVKAGFDIQTEARKLDAFYKSAVKRR